MLSTGRTHLTLAILLLIICILGFMLHTTTGMPAPSIEEIYNDASIHFEAAHAGVFWNNSCVELVWKADGIAGVWLDDVPTVGKQTRIWCIPSPSEYRGFYYDPAYPDLRVQFNNGTVRHYRLPIYVMQPFIERIIYPLLVVGLGLFATQLFPANVTLWFTKPRSIPVSWQSNLNQINMRKWGAITLIIGACLIFTGIFYRIWFAPPYQLTRTNQGSVFSIQVDPPVVFRANGCTTLTWETTNTKNLHIEGRSIPPQGHEQWCLPPRTTTNIVQFGYQREDGGEHRRTIAISAMQPILYYTILPMLILAAYLLKLHHHILPREWLDEKRYAKIQILRPFYDKGKLDRVLLILFLAINTLSISNIVRHNAQLAYDAEDHFLYGIMLSENRLPTADKTNQFFAPPLVYVLPSLVHRTIITIGFEPCTAYQGTENSCQIVAKTGLLQNIIATLGITYLLILIAGIMSPQSTALKVHSLAILGLFPVYYKMMVFHRGEPFVALFTLLLIHRILIMLPQKRKPHLHDILILGLSMGLLTLSRQWGFFTIAGSGLWALIIILQRSKQGLSLLWAGLWSYGIAIISGGWFYLLSAIRFGSATAFNRTVEASEPLLTLKPLDFYIGLGSGTLFTEAFRSARIRQIIPIFYTEIWGDYWGHFYLPGVDFSVWSANPPTNLIAYMSRVNIIALLPTTILLFGFIYGITKLYSWMRWQQDDNAPDALLQLVISISLIGYLWFMAQYPDSVGDTIKAGYMLHIYPLWSLITATLIIRTKQWNPLIYSAIIISLSFSAIYIFPMMVTHFTGIAQ